MRLMKLNECPTGRALELVEMGGTRCKIRQLSPNDRRIAWARRETRCFRGLVGAPKPHSRTGAKELRVAVLPRRLGRPFRAGNPPRPAPGRRPTAIDLKNCGPSAAGRGGGVVWKREAAATPLGSLIFLRNTGGIVALLRNHRLMAIIPPGCREGRNRRFQKLKSTTVGRCPGLKPGRAFSAPEAASWRHVLGARRLQARNPSRLGSRLREAMGRAMDR